MTNNQPDHLIKPAFEIGDWFESRNIKDWIVGPCASRQLVESLYKQIAEKDTEIVALKVASACGKSKDIRSLAEILMSECGYSTENWRLLNKVETRLWNFFDEQLSASQAREVKLREALKIAGMNCVDDFIAACALQLADTPTDTSALEEYVMSKLEVVAYQHRTGMLSCRLPGGGVEGIDWTPLYRIKKETE